MTKIPEISVWIAVRELSSQPRFSSFFGLVDVK